MEERPIRIVTWNCYRGAFGPKMARLGVLQPDIAVLQECERPDQESASVAWFDVGLRQGIAIFVRSPFYVLVQPQRHGADSMFAARVLGPVPSLSWQSGLSGSRRIRNPFAGGS
jgi:hypothetical protein